MAFCTPAIAEPAADATEATSDGSDILVTGSRIKRANLDTPAPIAIVTAEDFQARGAVNIEQVLNALPQAVSGLTAFSNNPGGGVATLDLRGLGPQRTLVLVNDRRYMFYDVNQQVDLNTIPQFLIQGAEVVTGGASAIYGSDAIAGVVNFRLRDIDGVEVGGQSQVTERGYGARKEAHVALGLKASDSDSHFTVYGEYYKRNPAFQGDRSITYYAQQDNATKTGFVNGGSASVTQGRFSTSAALGAGTNYTGLGAIFASPGISRPYTTADAYNYAPVNYMMVPQERWLGGAYGQYEISPLAKAYTEISFTSSRTDTLLAATPVSGTFSINIGNNARYLSAADVAQLRQIAARQGTAAQDTVSLSVARRVSEVGARSNHDDRNAYRVLGGVKGNLSDHWSYDAYYSYARTKNSQVQDGDVSKSAFAAALLSGSINIFGPNTITPEGVKAISIQAQNQDISVLQVASASATGRLFNFNWGADDVSIAFGTEYRSTHSQYIPDSAVASGDALGLGVGKPTKGGYNVKEAFAELRVPLVANRPGVYRLELTGAGRYSHYSLEAVRGTWTFGGGVEYSPFRQITLRGQYSRAVRAPSVAELYGGQYANSPTVADPCALASAATNATIKAVCIATGVPAADVGNSALQPNVQVKALAGGNPDLQEERSNSYTFGAVLRPVRRLNITADYYHIKVNHVVAPAAGGTANILNLCYNVIQNASNAVCQLIHRNPSSGIIDGSTNGDVTYSVTETTANLGQLVTSGADISLDYSIPLDFGLFSTSSQLSFTGSANYTDKFNTTPIAGLNSIIECAGKFGVRCGEPQPKLKTNARLAYRDGPITTSLGWRRLGVVHDDDPATTFTVERIKAYNLFDFSLVAKVGGMTWSAGINNLFDKKPPIIGSNQAEDNTYPSTYDVLGRDFFVSASIKF
ncbi:TonB-dependent receptor [Sphingomonas sp.]|uniref:TonB-dependent receptor n=1 Tax=Sphingomonas sp. TaxID=28214 RepID=UPI0025FC3FD4|nr:TonB-dependent receptor [Sphingomonas sp.]